MTRPTTDADDLSVHRDGGDQREMVLSEERMDVSTVTEEVGRARAVKHVDVETVTSRVERGT